MSDSRREHFEAVASLPRPVVLKAVDFLRGLKVAPKAIIREAESNPDWWIPHHFGAMMGIRNELRGNRFSEAELGVGNLDDYAVGLLELAWDITSLSEVVA